MISRNVCDPPIKMIDLHSHILPGIDDGAADLAVALQIARQSVAQGVSVLACTPHILPGLYHNIGPQIRAATQELQTVIDQEGIALRLVTGADVHMVPDFVGGLRSGRLLTLADSRYVLVEPPHHSAPPQLEDFFFNLLVAGYVPVLTHPERLSWVPSHYGTIEKLVQGGAWMQVTAGSITGAFGRTAQYWALKMLDEGLVHIVATDAHDDKRRPPILGDARDFVAQRIGAVEADHMVFTRPKGIVENVNPSQLPMPAIRAERPETDAAPDSGARGTQKRDPAARGFLGRLRELF
jgi:protein-tyrosine phosphatase